MQIVERTWIKTPPLPLQARSEREYGATVLWMATLRECFQTGILRYLGPFLKATKFGKGSSKSAQGYFYSRL